MACKDINEKTPEGAEIKRKASKEAFDRSVRLNVVEQTLEEERKMMILVKAQEKKKRKEKKQRRDRRQAIPADGSSLRDGKRAPSVRRQDIDRKDVALDSMYLRRDQSTDGPGPDLSRGSSTGYSEESSVDDESIRYSRSTLNSEFSTSCRSSLSSNPDIPGVASGLGGSGAGAGAGAGAGGRLNAGSEVLMQLGRETDDDESSNGDGGDGVRGETGRAGAARVNEAAESELDEENEEEALEGEIRDLCLEEAVQDAESWQLPFIGIRKAYLLQKTISGLDRSLLTSSNKQPETARIKSNKSPVNHHAQRVVAVTADGDITAGAGTGTTGRSTGAEKGKGTETGREGESCQSGHSRTSRSSALSMSISVVSASVSKSSRVVEGDDYGLDRSTSSRYKEKPHSDHSKKHAGKSCIVS
jgi:hypothetical protein